MPPHWSLNFPFFTGDFRQRGALFRMIEVSSKNAAATHNNKSKYFGGFFAQSSVPPTLQKNCPFSFLGVQKKVFFSEDGV
jgi:hypothetical protein